MRNCLWSRELSASTFAWHCCVHFFSIPNNCVESLYLLLGLYVSLHCKHTRIRKQWHMHSYIWTNRYLVPWLCGIQSIQRPIRTVVTKRRPGSKKVTSSQSLLLLLIPAWGAGNWGAGDSYIQYICIHMYIYTHIYIYICICIYMYMYTCICIYTFRPVGVCALLCFIKSIMVNYGPRNSR